MPILQRIFGDIGGAINSATSSGTLVPTFGFSFGLPQAGPGYGGYQQNPVGTGGAVNPYYNSPTGLEVGAVNVNPLFSFQATTNDDGAIAYKPLVNLHLTPNGCGVLGCDKEFADSITNFPKVALDSIVSPFKALKEAYIDAKKPAYYPGDSYGAPTISRPNYGAPQPSYGAPKPAYVAPKPSYGAQQPSYGVPKPSYQVPQENYVAPVVGPVYKPPHGSDHHNYDESPVTHEHHHYYHNKQKSTDSYDSLSSILDIQKQQINNNGALYYDDVNKNHVKRNSVPIDSPIAADNQFIRHTLPVTEDNGFISSSEDQLTQAQPNIGGSSTSSNSGFRFPKGRNLEFSNERKRRSPDGVGHHGAHGHHGHPANHGSQNNFNHVGQQLTATVRQL